MKTVRDPNTLDLFVVPQPEHAAPGSANYAFQVAHLVSEVLKAAPADRYDLAAQMSRLSGDEVSKNMLDAWASPARADHNVPFYRVPLLEEVAGTHALTDWLVGKRGGQVAYGLDALNARLGRMMTMKKQLDAQIRELQRLMGGEQ